MRYIELNPARAGICTDPPYYRWSSYRANAPGEATPWLTPHPLYATLVKDAAPRGRPRKSVIEGPGDGQRGQIGLTGLDG